MERYIVEGEWLGHTSAQRKIVHRKVHRLTPKGFARFKAVTSVSFSDNTVMLVSIRKSNPRERVQEILGYTRMIDDAAHVAQLLSTNKSPNVEVSGDPPNGGASRSTARLEAI